MNILCLLLDYIVGIDVEQVYVEQVYEYILCAAYQVQHFPEKFDKYFIIIYSF